MGIKLFPNNKLNADSFVPRPEIESFGWKGFEFELTQELGAGRRRENGAFHLRLRADVALNASKHRGKGDK